MKLLYGHNQEVADWVASRIPGMTSFGPCTAIGVLNSDNALVGGVVFHDFQPQWKNIQVSFAGAQANWLTPRGVYAMLEYPFRQVGVERITSLTPKRNRRARQFLNRFVFKHEGTIRRGFGDDDSIVSGLLRSEWDAHPIRCKGASTSAR